MGARGFAAIVVLLLACPSVRARPDDAAEANAKGAEVDVVVTASRHGQKVTESPAAVTVITAEDIAAAGFQSLPDILRRVPGLDLMQASPRDWNVSVRGFNNVLSRRLLVLIDGRSVYVNLMGFVMWDGLQVDVGDIERIEIVRGPGATLYGANASGGVVSITTKAPEDVGGTHARVAYGEGATLDAGVRSGDRHGKLGYKVSAGYYQTDAFANPDRRPESEFQQPGEAATRQPKANASLRYAVKDGAELSFDAGYAGTSGTLYTGIGPLDIGAGSRGVFARAAYDGDRLFLQASFSGLDGSTLNLTSRQENAFVTDTFDAEAQYDLALGKSHYLVLGGSARSSRIDSDLVGGKASHGQGGLYVQDEIKLGARFTCNLGLRADQDELMGAVLSPRASVVFAPDAANAFRLTLARAYNSPSFLESYLDYAYEPAPGLVISARGNLDLEPETIDSAELGWKGYPSGKVVLDATVFAATLRDYVQFVAIEEYAPGIPKTFSYVNSGEARERGVELQAELYPNDHLTLIGHYAWTDVSSDDVTDVTARHKAGLVLQYLHGRFGGSLGASYTSELAFTESSLFYEAGVVPAYTVVHGAAAWTFADGKLSLGLRGTNLLDRAHREYIAGDVIERRVLCEVKARF